MGIREEREDIDLRVNALADSRALAMMAVRDNASGHASQVMYLCGRAWDLAHMPSTTSDDSDKLMTAFYAVSRVAAEWYRASRTAHDAMLTYSTKFFKEAVESASKAARNARSAMVTEKHHMDYIEDILMRQFKENRPKYEIDGILSTGTGSVVHITPDTLE